MTPNTTAGSAARPATVDAFDWDVLTFVLSWAPYGGPGDEESLPRFGMSCAQLQARFADLIRTLSEAHPASLSAPQRELVAQGRRLLGSLVLDDEPTAVMHRPDDHFAIDLNQAAGRWELRQGVWHWTVE